MNENKPERRGLGRGLSALMSDVDLSDTDKTQSRGDRSLPIETVSPNPEQPRKEFSEEGLNELAASISERGIIQPLIVRPDPKRNDHYQIVAGERRWRAAQRAQLHDVPVVIRNLSDTEVLEVAIVENIQRADLNAVEEALGYRQLQDRFGHTQDQIATALGKSRSHIANLLRLLNLPHDVLTWLREGKLSAGHARALVPTEDPTGLARKIIAQNLSVRQAEALAKRSTTQDETQKATPKQRQSAKDADTIALEGDLSASLGMKVDINHHEGQEQGQLTISYANFADLDTLCRRLSAIDGSNQ